MFQETVFPDVYKMLVLIIKKNEGINLVNLLKGN